jgi:hypothetical protein
MTMIIIENGQPDDYDTVQEIITAHGFGKMTESAEVWSAPKLDDLKPKEKADLKKELETKVGSHLVISFA